MAAMQKDFLNCNALIYDEAGELLANALIIEYDKAVNSIVVLDMFSSITAKTCDVLIPMAPKPYAYRGQIQGKGDRKVIRLSQEKTRDNRKDPRYKVDLPALIEGLIYDSKMFAMQTPLEVRLLDISKDGMKFRSVFNALAVGHVFQIRLKIGGNDKILAAEVVFSKDSPPSSEYGCRMVEGVGDQT
jgi:hypothetical protein